MAKGIKGIQKGEHISPETEFKKGHMPWIKGRHHSIEARKKMSFANLGRKKPRSVEHQAKLAKPCSECGCFIPKNGEHKCKTAWNKGKNKENTPILAKMGFQKGHKVNLGRFVGRTTTKEQCKKNKKNGLRGLLKQQNMKEPTSIEKKVYDELKARGLLFEKQKLINGKFLVDAYIPSFNLVVEADGNYWHSLDRVKKRDKAKNAYLIKCGYKLLRLSETEIKDGSFKERLVN